MHRVTGASVLIVAAVIAVDPAGLWPFGPARWLVVSAGGVGVVAWCLARPEWQLDRRTVRLWMVLLACLTAGALANHDVWMALMGTDTRHFGLATWLLCCGLFFAGQQLRGHEHAVLKACTVAAVVVGSWSLWELVVGPPIALATTTSRLTGPFGSAALLGAAVCLFLPPAVAVAADRGETRPWRVIAAIAASSCAAAALGSGARAAWCGLLVAAVVVAWRVRRARRPLVVGGGAVLVAALLAMPLVGSVLERDQGAASRLDEWRVATRVIGNHPLLGVGPEGYRIAVSEGIDDEYERAHLRDEVLPDRAHASLLDVALAGGLLAAAAYGGLLLVIGTRVIRRLPTLPGAQVALAASLLAYFSAQLLLFPVFELDPIAWLLAGVAVAGTRPAPPRTVASTTSRRLLTAAGVLVGATALVGGLLDVAANRLARDALSASAGGSDDTADELAGRAARLRPDSIAYRMTAVRVLLAADTLRTTDAALGQAEEAVRWSAHDPIAVDLRATSLLQRALQTGSAADTAAAVAAWQVLVERDPHRGRWQLQLGIAAAAAGDNALARQAWQRAEALGQARATQLLEELP